MKTIKMCPGPECDEPGVTKGLCAAHYQQSRKGELRAVKRYSGRSTSPCLVDSCGDIGRTRGLCYAHISISARHHIDPAEYARIYNLGCANPACSETESLQVDHDHSCECDGKLSTRSSCGKCVRGVLCKRCNRLASFADQEARNPDLALGIREYIQSRANILEYKYVNSRGGLAPDA